MKIVINLFFIVLLLVTNSCSKKDDCENPVDCLPPATQTGANTAGCLVNGEVLLPGGKSLGSGSVLKAQYVFNNGNYVFGISIWNREGKNRMVVIESNQNKIVEGGTYALREISPISVSGSYIFGLDAYTTTNSINGELKITHLNETRNIVSGTFWFDALNNENEIVQIREGRFDVHYY